VTGICGASILSASFSSSVFFSPAYAGLVSSGNGCCGVLAAVLRIITKAAVTGDYGLKVSASIYQFLAAVIILGILLYFLCVSHHSEGIREGLQRPTTPRELQDLLPTIKVIWPIWTANAVDFLITLTFFPGYVSSIRKKRPWCSWTPVVVTAVFCAFDWVGRWLATRFSWRSEKFVLVPVYIRLVFVAVFMISFQNVADLGEPYWRFFWMIPFALTNGYIGTLTVVSGSNHSELNEGQRVTAGFLMNFAINSGILIAMGLTFAIPTPRLPVTKEC
jgi:equilibrative nucleoside transporter 1/2/3